MARYDTYGFRGATPTGNFDQRSYTASGSEPSRTAPPDDSLPSGVVTGVPNVGVAMRLDAQTGPGEGASPNQPGQNDLGITGASGEAGYTDSGAGQGSNLADAHRYPWQQKPGG